MGDLVSPKRRDVFDRLRRRLEQYRRRQNQTLCRYSNFVNGYSEQQRRGEQTSQLHQKWIESRAKRNAKNSKANRDSHSTSEQQRNPPLTQKLKRKLDSAQGSQAPASTTDSAFVSEEPASPPTKACKTGQAEAATHSVSVNIDLQQTINTQLEHSQTSEIKLTVSSTLHTGGSNPAASGPGNTSTSASVSTSASLKREPADDTQESNSSQASFPDSIGLEDEDLEALLETFDGDIAADLDLDFVDSSPTEQDSIKKDQDSVEDGNGGGGGQVPDLSARSRDATHPKEDCNSGMFADPLYETPNLAATAQNFNGMGGTGAAPVNGGYPRPPTCPPSAGPAPPILGDTGPAAETLKQMAAQHQNQESAQYAMKGVSTPSYGSDIYPDNFGGRRPSSGGYGPYAGQGYGMHNAQHNMYYNQQMTGQMPSAMGATDGRPPSQHMQPAMAQKTDSSMGVFGSTKPLSHFPEPSASGASPTPSTLQQLKNQVQSHFSQAPGGQGGQQPAAAAPGAGHMQITQSQHLQMSHGSRHVQLSQTQQMQIQGSGPAQPISVAQQQSFSMSPGMGSQGGGHMGQGPVSQQYSAEQIKMQQMYQEKMRMEQQQQMQPYMNRPPPEYKMPTGPGQGGYQTNNGSMATTPLQTMQTMVNQTASHHMNGMYPQQQGQSSQQVKQEMGGVTPGQHSLPQMGGQRQQQQQQPPQQQQQQQPPQQQQHQGSRASPLSQQGHAQQQPAGSPMPQSHGGMQGPASQGGYNPHIPSQAMGPPGQMGTPHPPQSMVNGTGTGPSRPGKAGTPTYTSAIMRGQRPPNVNVGPDGLNITQQRTHHPSEWPRHMMPQGPQMSHVVHAQQMAHMQQGQQVPQGGMMQYGGYGSHQSMGMAVPRMHVAQQQQQQQQQQQAMAGQQRVVRQGPGGVPHMSHMPPQSTGSMMMSQQQQQMQMQNGQAMAAMSQSSAMRGPHPHSTATSSHNYPTASSSGGAPPGSDFSLDFLDNPQTNSSDFFDSVVQNANPSDFNFIDDILGGGK